MAEAGRIEVERRGAVTCVIIDNPAKRNALDMPMRDALYEALAAAAADRECRAIVLAGRGAHFCAGGDISTLKDITPIVGRARIQQIARIPIVIEAAEKPVIAAVEGAAAGAGLSLASACDFVVAARDARFACPFNKLGLAPDTGLTWTLPARVGAGRAKMLMLSGRPIDAVEAERIGLVEVLAEPGQALETALQLAADIAAAAPLANAITKSLVNRASATLTAHLAAEADAQSPLYVTEDLKEGVAAFAEKRAPNFQGK